MPTERFGIVTYTTEEACKRIGRCKRTVLQHIYSKRIADVRPNDIGHREWLEKDIKRFSQYFAKLAEDRLNKTKRRPK